MEGTAGAGARGKSEPAIVEKSRRSQIVRLALIALGIVVFLILIVLGVRYLAYATAHETTDDATIDADEIQVTSKISERVDKILVDTNQQVRKGQLLIALDNRDETARYTQANAAVEAQRAQARAAQENVTLTRATQSAQDLENTGGIDQAKAAITSAAATAQSSTQQIAAAQAAVDSSRAQLKAAQDAVPGALENLRKAAADLKRTQSLVATGDVAASQLDSDRAAYESARSTYSQRQADVGTALANLAQSQQKLDSQRYATSSTESQIDVQQAQLTTAQGRLQESSAPSRISSQQAQADASMAQVASLLAQRSTASDNLSYTRIYSPINGYVGQKNIEIGQTIAAGESLLTLIPATHVYVTANFKETQIGRMRVGQEVDINVDAYHGVKFVGHVEDLSPASQNKFSLVPAQNATGNFVKVTQRLPVRILFDSVEHGRLADYPLRPGMSVETSVKVK
ncbi:MAG: HlyD family secretion protein [Candidatus Eremiobacteraeota bacterium]|nr:HlyD family secretion protein [Candidatus Eremiobacteraeota bacterium]